MREGKRIYSHPSRAFPVVPPNILFEFHWPEYQKVLPLCRRNTGLCLYFVPAQEEGQQRLGGKKAVFAILGVGGLATYRVSVSEVLSHNDVSIPQDSATIKEEQTETL